MLTRTRFIVIVSFFAVAVVAGWASAQSAPIAQNRISVSANR